LTIDNSVGIVRDLRMIESPEAMPDQASDETVRFNSSSPPLRTAA
jgi:hypothetical protein